MSLTARVIISFGLIALAGLAFLLNPVLDRVERQYLEATEEPMVDVAEILAGLLAHQPGDSVVVPETFREGMADVAAREFEAKIYNLMKEKVLMDFYVTDANGRVLYDSGEIATIGDDFSAYLDVYRTLAGSYGARSTKVDPDDTASTIMYVGAPIVKRGEIAGMISVYKPQRSMLSFVLETKRWLVFLGLVALVLVLIFGWILSRWVTRPLGKLTEYAAAVAKGKRHPAPQLPGYHLRVLGETTEAMRDALEDRKYVESYVQSLTHEMKSPVAGIRGAVELLHEDLPEEKRTQFLGNIEGESRRLQDLIDQLLALSSLENRNELGMPTELSLSSLVRDVVNRYTSQAADKSVELEFLDTKEDSLSGEVFLLETAISNLLQNALDFSPNGGRIRIVVSNKRDELELTIADEGCGMPEYAVERIFDRFYSLPRPNNKRKSSGLGLCFAREAIMLHGGSLTILNRNEGRGVLATVRFPR